MQKVYAKVTDIDLFVGGLAEKSNGGLVGPTFGCLIGTQFQKLMSGDRFFFTHKDLGTNNEKGFPAKAKESIRKRTLGDVICDNTDTTETRGRVMVISNDVIKCSERPDIDFSAFVQTPGEHVFT